MVTITHSMIINVKARIAKLRTERGEWLDISGRKDFYAYSRKVRSLTEQNYRQYKMRINPDGHKRTPKLHLDHIYSIKDGYTNKIDEAIIAHPANLRLIDDAKNHSKSSKSAITIEELFALIVHERL